MNDLPENPTGKNRTKRITRTLDRVGSISSAGARGFWLLLNETINKFSLDKAWQKGAALAFYTILSLAPTLLIVVKVIDSLYDPAVAMSEISTELEIVVGTDSAEFIDTLITGAEAQASRTLPTALSILTVFIGATSFFTNMKHAMDHAWGADPKTARGIVFFLRTRLIAFLFITAVSFFIIALLIGDALINLGSRVIDLIPPGDFYNLIHFVMSISVARTVFRFIMLTLLIAFIYKVLPDAFIRWRDALIGAAVTAFLVSLGQLAIGYYLRNNTSLSAYGAASSIMVLLVWLYYTSLVFFYGVEFTYVYAEHYGTPIIPQESPLIIRAKKTVKKLRREKVPLLKERIKKSLQKNGT